MRSLHTHPTALSDAPRQLTWRSGGVIAACVVTVVLAAACSSDEPSEQTEPTAVEVTVLTSGSELYERECSGCHGGSDGDFGGGHLVEEFPDPLDQAAIIADGRRDMPGFAETLSSEEIDAIVVYTREEL